MLATSRSRCVALRPFCAPRSIAAFDCVCAGIARQTLVKMALTNNGSGTHCLCAALLGDAPSHLRLDQFLRSSRPDIRRKTQERDHGCHQRYLLAAALA